MRPFRVSYPTKRDLYVIIIACGDTVLYLDRVNHPWTTEAIRLLGVAFPWDQTLEGEAFRFDIVKRLQRIKDRGR